MTPHPPPAIALKIAIVAPNPVPFTRGGAERAWSGLHAALLDEGHDAEILKLPVRETTLAEVVAGYRAFSTLDLEHFDVVISSKYPAWICPHRRHVLWMFHPLRGLYDTYHVFGLPTVPGAVEPASAAVLDVITQPPRRAALPQVLDRVDAAVATLGAEHPDLALPGPVSRLVVRWLDRVALDPSEVTRHVALSRTVATRAGYLPDGVTARVAYAPPDLIPPAAPLPPGRHLFTASRLDGPKRLDLLIEAMAHVPGDVELHIGGTGPQGDRLRALAAPDPRIRFLGRVSDHELATRYAEALAVPFVPLDEDYGLIAVEALAAGTPVVTTTDSGGPAELVRDGVDGAVVDPDPAALGRALAALAADPTRARSLGEEGRRHTARITWPAVVRTLLGSGLGGRETNGPGAGPGRADRTGSPDRTRRPGRPRVVVLTTFRVAERGHGGQLRSYHLYGNLARHAEVEVVSLTDGGPPGSVELRPGLVETSVPISGAHQRAAEELSLAAGVPVSDLTAGEHIQMTPDYLRQLREATRSADVVILAEPYLLPALDHAGIDLPFVYDAFNVEADLKASVLPGTAAGAGVLERVIGVETDAARRAAVITACSAEDAARLAALVGRPGSDAVVVANGTDCAATTPVDPAVRRRRGERWLARYRTLDHRTGAVEALAVFFGSWHPPNLDAARRIVDEVAPAVPEVLFLLGGRHGDAFATRTTPPNVVLAGRISDRSRDTLLGAAHLALNPMATGSGTNLKVLEYLAAGVPVVTTGFGIRGLDLTNGEHLLVGAPDQLDGAIRTLLADPVGASARARAGRARVEEGYDWPRLGDRLAEIIGGVVAVERPGPARGAEPARR